MGHRQPGHDGKDKISYLSALKPKLSSPEPTTLLSEAFQLMFSKEEKPVNISGN
jgi:hypothetical protein